MTRGAQHFFESMANWDESHIQPLVEARHEGREMSLADFDTELAEGKSEWKRQFRNDIQEWDVDPNQAWEWWRAAYLEAARQREALRRNPSALTGTSPLDQIFVKDRVNGWHVEASYRDGVRMDYGPFQTKGRAMKMREAMIESDLQRNPSPTAEDVEAAEDKYKQFHRYDPSRIEELGQLEIPARVRKLGDAKHVIYLSAKIDPSTLKKPRKPTSYIHEHDSGVMVYSTDGTADTDVPDKFASVTALVHLGKCLGFALCDGTEAEGTDPLPDLACTPDGKCLFVIQGKKKVLAMMWGGALGVFPRGIDG